MTFHAKTLATLASASLLVALPAAPSVADASGGTDRGSSAIAKANPGISRELLDSLPSSILDRGDITISPDIVPGSPFVTTEGEVLPGQTSAQNQLAHRALNTRFAACSQRVVVPTRTTVVVQRKACPAVIGMNAKTTWTYAVHDDPNTNGVVSWSPKGFYPKTVCKLPIPYKDRQCSTTWAYKWYPWGVYPKTRTVLWGPVAAYPAAQFQTVTFPLGWAGAF